MMILKVRFLGHPVDLLFVVGLTQLLQELAGTWGKTV